MNNLLAIISIITHFRHFIQLNRPLEALRMSWTKAPIKNKEVYNPFVENDLFKLTLSLSLPVKQTLFSRGD